MDPPGARDALDGLSEIRGPFGDTLTESVTVPVSAFRLVTFRLDEPEKLAGMIRDVGAATNRKSCTLTVISTETER